jgi:alpha-beta hydrolase superfamily lysophospholipase
MAPGGLRRGLLRRLGRLAGAVIGGYLGFLSVEGSRRVVRPERRPFVPDAGAPATPAELGLDYEDVRFTTDDGVTLAGWLIHARRETRAAVVLLHGFSWNRLPWLTAFAPWLAERYHVLQFDFRGHGASGDADITLGSAERRDVAAAVRLLESRGLGPIALMGISMGAAVAILAAPDLPVAAVVADAPYADLHNPIGNRMREEHYPLPGLGSRLIVAAASVRARTWLLSPISRVAALAPRGLLVIAPSADELIDHAQSRRLFAAAREPKELYVVSGAGHSEAREIGGDEYAERVLAFLSRHLDGDAGATAADHAASARTTSVGGEAGQAL